MGNKQAPKQIPTDKENHYSNVNQYSNVEFDTTNDSFNTSSHSPLPTTNSPYPQSLHSHSQLPSINSTNTSFSSEYYSGNRFSFSASNSHTQLSYGHYPDLGPLQDRVEQDILHLIIMYMDILSRIQISICCKHFNKTILSQKCLSDVWIIHGLTHKKNTLWEVPMANTLRSHRKIRHRHHQLSKTKSTPIPLSPPSTSGHHHHPLKSKKHQKHGKHGRSSSYSFSFNQSRSSSKKRIIKRNKRRQSAMKAKDNHNDNTMIRKTLPRSLPPEKIFGFEDLKEAEHQNEEKDDRIINGKNLVISTGTDYIKIRRRRRRRKRFNELNEYNIVVADFKKYLLQFRPIIKYARCLVVGADGLPTTLRDFIKLRWIPTVMTIEYLALERNNNIIASEILNSFAHSLKYLSIKGDVHESLELNDLNIYALRISMNFNQSLCEYIWTLLPSSLKYLCLFRTVFDTSLLNKSMFNSLYDNLLHLSLIECRSSSHDIVLSLPPSLISLHIKGFQGRLSCKECKRLWEIVVFVDMKAHNQLGKSQRNVINIAALMQSLEFCSKIIKQIIFYEYNNLDGLVLPNQLMFSDWKDVGNVLVVVPNHWLNDEKFKMKFEYATFSNIKKDIVHYYNEKEDKNIVQFNNKKEKEFRKELRQRVGYSMFADFYNNTHVGEFNLSKFVRNGHHQLSRRQN